MRHSGAVVVPSKWNDPVHPRSVVLILWSTIPMNTFIPSPGLIDHHLASGQLFLTRLCTWE